MKRAFTLIEFLVTVAIIAMMIAIAIPALMKAKEANSPTEAEAAANRERLAKVPVQTEGITVKPMVEAPMDQGAETPVLTIKFDKMGEIKCPHCGQLIRLKAE